MRPIIQNVSKLIDDIAYYANMFPNSHTTYDFIEQGMERMDENDTLLGGIFGIEVSSEWEDKCYGFEPKERTPNGEVIVEYLGIMKC